MTIEQLKAKRTITLQAAEAHWNKRHYVNTGAGHVRKYHELVAYAQEIVEDIELLIKLNDVYEDYNEMALYHQNERGLYLHYCLMRQVIRLIIDKRPQLTANVMWKSTYER